MTGKTESGQGTEKKGTEKMSEKVNEKLIRFMQEDLKLRHSKRSNKITVEINGLQRQCRDVDEAAGLICCNTNIYKNNSNWQLFKAEVQSNLEAGEDFSEKLPGIIRVSIAALLSAKTAAASRISGNAEASAFSSFVKELSELPKNGFNAIDRTIMKRFKYCPADTCIYLKKKNGGLSLIGKFESLKRDPTQAGICKVINEEIGAEWNEGVPMKIGEYVAMCLNAVTKLRHRIIACVKAQIDGGKSFEEAEVETDFGKFAPGKMSYSDDLNALENAAHDFCIEVLWRNAPCSLFTSKFIVLKAMFNTYELSNPDGAPRKVNEFTKYTYDVVRSGSALTAAAYLSNIFNVYAEEFKDDDAFIIRDVPRTYSDGDGEALFRYDEACLKESLKEIGCYTKLEDCQNLSLLKSWMNEDEFRLAMAWAYAAVHPCTVKSNIALLLWTGGGTGKSSFVAMVKYAMMLACGGREEDLYFEIKGDKFIKDDKNWMPDGQIGLPKAALVNIDEATTECIETYKNFSGSADKNRLSLRLNYENAVDYDVKGKFIFTTNKGLQLTSDDGSLLRRVAVIKHQGVQNVIGARPKTNEEIVLEYKRQIPMMLALGKRALAEILGLGYDSLDAYAMKCTEINKNLRESTSASANTEAYAQIWAKLEEDMGSYRNIDGSFRLRGNALKKLYEQVCAENGEDFKWFGNFKKFILEHPAMFTGENAKKHARKFISWNPDKEDFELINVDSNGIYFMYPLNAQAQPEGQPEGQPDPFDE